MKSEIKLKPCPFCVKKPIWETWSSGGAMFMVKCDNSDCPIPENGYPTGRVRSEVAQEWNRRADND